MRARLRSLDWSYASWFAFYRDAAVHFCATFLFEAATFVTIICLFYNFAKFSTILASIVGYDPIAQLQNTKFCFFAFCNYVIMQSMNPPASRMSRIPQGCQGFLKDVKDSLKLPFHWCANFESRGQTSE